MDASWERLHRLVFDPHGPFAVSWYDIHHIPELFAECAELEHIYHKELENMYILPLDQYPVDLETALKAKLPMVAATDALDDLHLLSDCGDDVYEYTSVVHRYILSKLA